MNSGAPDLIVAGVMSALFLTSSYQILRQSWAEWKHADEHDHHDHDDDHDHEHEEEKPQ
jgi:hypothetical protein